MTKYKNKKHWSLKFDYDYLIKTQSDSTVRRFLIEVMELLNDYRVENIKYRERIKTLKEVLRMMKDIR
jgi:hypothetical protein